MKNLFFWFGISFVIGGSVSLALTLAVEGRLGRFEDLTGYSMGWMAIGLVFIIYSFLKK